MVTEKCLYRQGGDVNLPDKFNQFFLVLKPPVITTPPKENIRIGSDVTLQCTSNGFPIPQFQWFNDNNVVVSVKSSLKLIGVTMATSGRYTCLANNGVSKEEKTIELIIPCEFHFLFYWLICSGLR